MPGWGVQEYKGETDKEAFEAFYKGCEHPLYYNGDILTLEDIQTVTERFPRLEGVMIGRGLLANPALAQEYVEDKVLAGEERLRRFKAFHAELLGGLCRTIAGGSSVVDEDENVLGVFHAFDRSEDFEKNSQEQ